MSNTNGASWVNWSREKQDHWVWVYILRQPTNCFPDWEMKPVAWEGWGTAVPMYQCRTCKLEHANTSRIRDGIRAGTYPECQIKPVPNYNFEEVRKLLVTLTARWPEDELISLFCQRYMGLSKATPSEVDTMLELETMVLGHQDKAARALIDCLYQAYQDLVEQSARSYLSQGPIYQLWDMKQRFDERDEQGNPPLFARVGPPRVVFYWELPYAAVPLNFDQDIRPEFTVVLPPDWVLADNYRFFRQLSGRGLLRDEPTWVPGQSQTLSLGPYHEITCRFDGMRRKMG